MPDVAILTANWMDYKKGDQVKGSEAEELVERQIAYWLSDEALAAMNAPVTSDPPGYTEPKVRARTSDPEPEPEVFTRSSRHSEAANTPESSGPEEATS